LFYRCEMETELQLLNAIRSGEKGAQRRLYERFAGQAIAIGMRYVPDPDQVRDVVHDSFVKILTAVNQFHYRGEGSLKAWVNSIVAHQAINFLREHERLQLTDLTAEIVEEEEPDIGRISAEELTRLIGQLPAGYRMVLNLYVFEQLSHKEIGHLLGIKPESSASQYSRAKQMLAREIMNYLKNDK